MENQSDIISKTHEYVKETLANDATGHDWWHVVRVTNTAKTLAVQEGADLITVELGALLHDIADWKFHDGDAEIGPKLTKDWLTKLRVDQNIIDEVEFIVRYISFKGNTNKTPMRTLEGKIVQDADRLDALGAVGIARAFAFGGSKQRSIHNPNISPKQYENFEAFKSAFSEGTTINHFYEKLLLLKDRMNTVAGKQLAEHRHQFLERYLEEFYAEWDGKK